MKMSKINILFAQMTNKDVGLLLFRIFAVFPIVRTHGIPKLISFEKTLAHIPDPLGFGQLFRQTMLFSVRF